MCWYPRMITVSCDLGPQWGDPPHKSLPLVAGELIDCQPGSELETAIYAAGGGLRDYQPGDEQHAGVQN